ncbi:MAG: transposase [Thermoanaerobaculia bacterium]
MNKIVGAYKHTPKIKNSKGISIYTKTKNRRGVSIYARNRKSIRLKGYDYSHPGGYFITICTYNRKHLFGKIINGKMALNDGGKIVQQYWLEIPKHFPNAGLDEFIIMPNHVHGIIMIHNNVQANDYSPSKFKSPSKTIGSTIRGFKIAVTKGFRFNSNVYIVWQRNYYEHIIRNENELNKIREYIVNNPLQWRFDRESPWRANDYSPLQNPYHDLEEKIYGKK